MYRFYKKLISFSKSDFAKQFTLKEYAYLLGDGVISDSKFEGGHLSHTLPIIASLMKNYPPALSDTQKETWDAIQLQFLQAAELDKKSYRDQVDAVLSLDKGNSVLLTGGYSRNSFGHALLYLIQHELDGTYSLKVINGGEGLNFHPQAKSNKKTVYNPVLMFAGISKESMNQANLMALLALKEPNPNHSIALLYESALVAFNGTPVMDSQPVDTYISGSRSGICFFKVTEALLRHYCSSTEATGLQTKDYKAFKLLWRRQVLSKFYDRVLQTHNEDSHFHKHNLSTQKLLRYAARNLARAGLKYDQNWTLSFYEKKNIEFLSNKILQDVAVLENEDKKSTKTLQKLSLNKSRVLTKLNEAAFPEKIKRPRSTFSVEGVPDTRMVLNIHHKPLIQIVREFQEFICSDRNEPLTCLALISDALTKLPVPNLSNMDILYTELEDDHRLEIIDGFTTMMAQVAKILKNTDLSIHPKMSDVLVMGVQITAISDALLRYYSDLSEEMSVRYLDFLPTADSLKDSFSKLVITDPIKQDFFKNAYAYLESTKQNRGVALFEYADNAIKIYRDESELYSENDYQLFKTVLAKHHLLQAWEDQVRSYNPNAQVKIKRWIEFQTGHQSFGVYPFPRSLQSVVKFRDLGITCHRMFKWMFNSLNNFEWVGPTHNYGNSWSLMFNNRGIGLNPEFTVLDAALKDVINCKDHSKMSQNEVLANPTSSSEFLSDRHVLALKATRSHFNLQARAALEFCDENPLFLSHADSVAYFEHCFFQYNVDDSLTAFGKELKMNAGFSGQCIDFFESKWAFLNNVHQDQANYSLIEVFTKCQAELGSKILPSDRQRLEVLSESMLDFLMSQSKTNMNAARLLIALVSARPQLRMNPNHIEHAVLAYFYIQNLELLVGEKLKDASLFQLNKDYFCVQQLFWQYVESAKIDINDLLTRVLLDLTDANTKQKQWMDHFNNGYFSLDDYCINISRGELFFKGEKRGHLPNRITHHSLFKKVYKDQNFIVISKEKNHKNGDKQDFYVTQDGKKQFLLEKSSHTKNNLEVLHISDEIVTPDGNQRCWVMSPEVFRNTSIPETLIENYTHWLSSNRETIWFQNKAGVITIKGVKEESGWLFYKIKGNQETHQLVLMDSRNAELRLLEKLKISNQSHLMISSQGSNDYHQTLQVLEYLDRRSNIEVWQALSADQMYFELPRHNLSFCVNTAKESDLVSTNFPGFWVSHTQSTQTNLPRYDHGVVLKNKTGQEKIIFPNCTFEWKKSHASPIVGVAKTEFKELGYPSYFVYSRDKTQTFLHHTEISHQIHLLYLAIGSEDIDTFIRTLTQLGDNPQLDVQAENILSNIERIRELNAVQSAMILRCLLRLKSTVPTLLIDTYLMSETDLPYALRLTDSEHEKIKKQVGYSINRTHADEFNHDFIEACHYSKLLHLTPPGDVDNGANRSDRKTPFDGNEPIPNITHLAASNDNHQLIKKWFRTALGVIENDQKVSVDALWIVLIRLNFKILSKRINELSYEMKEAVFLSSILMVLIRDKDTINKRDFLKRCKQSQNNTDFMRLLMDYAESQQKIQALKVQRLQERSPGDNQLRKLGLETSIRKSEPSHKTNKQIRDLGIQDVAKSYERKFLGFVEQFFDCETMSMSPPPFPFDDETEFALEMKKSYEVFALHEMKTYRLKKGVKPKKVYDTIRDEKEGIETKSQQLSAEILALENKKNRGYVKQSFLEIPGLEHDFSLEEIARLVFSGDEHEISNKNPLFDRVQDLPRLKTLLSHYLVLGIVLDQLNRTRAELIQVQDNPQKLQNVVSTLLQHSAYDTNQRYDNLLFEYQLGLKMRPLQVDTSEKLADLHHHIQELAMGAGKTTVVATLLAMLLSDGNHLATSIIPQSLLTGFLDILKERFGGGNFKTCAC